MNRARLLPWVIGAALIVLTAVGVPLTAPSEASIWGGRLEAFVALVLAQGALHGWACWLLLRRGTAAGGLGGVLLVAALMRLPAWAGPPVLSSDVYRYVWDGRVQAAAGINPYLYVPAAPELRALRDEDGGGPSAIYPNINRAEEAPTIYPPVAQGIFALVGRVWPTVWGMKAAMAGFDALAALAALALLHAARLPRERVLVYVWHPLPVWEFAGNGHVDAAALCFAALAMLAAVRLRPGLAGAALGAAALCKLLPLAVTPALWRRWDWRTPLACVGAIAAGYAWYAGGAGWRVLGYLPGYTAEEGLSDGSGFFLLRALSELAPLPRWAGLAYAAAALLGLVGLAAWVARRAPLPADPASRATTICRDADLLAGAAMAAPSPHYPWYMAWLVLPACVVLLPSALRFAASAARL
jgi:alpha-1,6-mannosyltransferase